MKKQLLIAMAVFTVGFAVGYGITWLLVSGGGPEDGGARAEVKSGLAAEGGGTAGTAAKVGATTDPPKTNPTAPANAGGGDEGEGEEGIGTAPVKPAIAPVTPKTAEKDAGVADAGTAEANAGGDVAAGPDESGSANEGATTWWDRCVGKRCLVNWGAVKGGISLRKGTIKHGSRVDWKLRFGGAARVDTVKAGGRTVVEVRGVGLGMDGLPTCAEVEFKKGGKTVTGIIALKLGSKRISMEPVTP